MGLDKELVGKQISLLRTRKKMTQSELGERLNISYQAVSKWERGEALPDICILPDLAHTLETTVDNLLCCSPHNFSYKGTMKVSDMIEGINCLKKMGELLGKDNQIYSSAVNGINESMNTDIEKAFTDDYVFEAFVAEAIIQNIALGMYVDITDINRNFKHRHFSEIVCKYAKEHNMV